MIRCGVDVVSVQRIAQALEKFGERFSNRILTPFERNQAAERKDLSLYVASRFAAKEAVYKALDIPDLTWQRVEIRHQGRRPAVWVDGVRRSDVDLSISHEHTVAVAMVVRLEPEPPQNHDV